jgi:hypothetical protein
LCFWFVQITRTTPARRTILHLSQIFFTDALTFIARLRSASLAKFKTVKTASSKPRPLRGSFNVVAVHHPVGF